jgi:hypothetical protein
MLPGNTTDLLGDVGMYGKKFGKIERSPNNSLNMKIRRYLSMTECC